jgi:hypothetical protein
VQTVQDALVLSEAAMFQIGGSGPAQTIKNGFVFAPFFNWRVFLPSAAIGFMRTLRLILSVHHKYRFKGLSCFGVFSVHAYNHIHAREARSRMRLSESCRIVSGKTPHLDHIHLRLAGGAFAQGIGLQNRCAILLLEFCCAKLHAGITFAPEGGATAQGIGGV